MHKIIYKRQQHTIGGRKKKFFLGSDILPHISGTLLPNVTILVSVVLECRPLSNESILNALALVLFVLLFYPRQKQFFQKNQYFYTQWKNSVDTL